MIIGLILQFIVAFFKLSIGITVGLTIWFVKAIFGLMIANPGITFSVACIITVIIVIFNMWIKYDTDPSESYYDFGPVKHEDKLETLKDNIARVEIDVFGDEIYYDSSGKKIGRGETDVFGDVRIYDDEHKDIGVKRYDVFGDAQIYDTHYNKKYVGEKDVFGDVDYYDDNHKKVARGTYDVFGDEKIKRKEP